jgi:hypothetical protein
MMWRFKRIPSCLTRYDPDVLSRIDELVDRALEIANVRDDDGLSMDSLLLNE